MNLKWINSLCPSLLRSPMSSSPRTAPVVYAVDQMRTELQVLEVSREIIIQLPPPESIPLGLSYWSERARRLLSIELKIAQLKSGMVSDGTFISETTKPRRNSESSEEPLEF